MVMVNLLSYMLCGNYSFYVKEHTVILIHSSCMFVVLGERTLPMYYLICFAVNL